MRRVLTLAALLTLLLALSLVLPAQAQPVPRLVSYQGVLYSSGSPVTSATSVDFALFTDAACTTAFPASGAWTQTHSVTPDAAGVFSALLGSTDPANAAFFDFAFDRLLYLKTSIGGTQVACHEMAAAPYALGLYGLRVEPETATEGPNVIGGASVNSVGAGVVGATISGGGDPSPARPNQVTANYATVGGGSSNEASGGSSTVGGGWSNTTGGVAAAVGGGASNEASGNWATVGGGEDNTASGFRATVGGGYFNTASAFYATVGGGYLNRASGLYATVPGGGNNVAGGDYSFAAGRRAKANHQGTFVWADSEIADFVSTGPDQFLLRAGGGVGIGTNSPQTPLHVAAEDFSLSATTFENDVLVLEGIDAVMGLYSTSGSNWGSAVVLAEHDGVGLTDKWAIARQTTGGSGDSSLRFTFGTDANYGVNDAKVRFDTDGTVHADGAYASTGADLAEAFAVEGAASAYAPGDVLVISLATDRTVEKSADAYSTAVAGVYATKPGVLLGEIEGGPGEKVPMGVVGVLPTKVTLEGGPIRRGDLLVTSSTPGHAMKGTPMRVQGVAIYPAGTVLGKALAPFDGPGTGLIEVLVNVK